MRKIGIVASSSPLTAGETERRGKPGSWEHGLLDTHGDGVCSPLTLS
jgi:hypothetical protein